MALSVRAAPKPVAVNLLGVVEHPEMGPDPYLVDRDGRPFVPAGDGGVVLGVHVGDPLWSLAGEHVAPGATLAHPDGAARHALTAQACLGNAVEVLTGAARGSRGRVVGKRGEAGRVIVSLPDAALARLLPGDRVRVEAFGQGAALEGVSGVEVMNVDPALLAHMPLHRDGERVTAEVRAVVPGRLCGNGVGRPSALWDLDLQVYPAEAGRIGCDDLRLGDLVAIEDWDGRFNHGYRRGTVTVGVVVHGPSRLPGHGPGVVAVLTGASERLAPAVRVDPSENLDVWLRALDGRGP